MSKSSNLLKIMNEAAKSQKSIMKMDSLFDVLNVINIFYLHNGQLRQLPVKISKGRESGMWTRLTDTSPIDDEKKDKINSYYKEGYQVGYSPIGYYEYEYGIGNKGKLEYISEVIPYIDKNEIELIKIDDHYGYVIRASDSYLNKLKDNIKNNPSYQSMLEGHHSYGGPNSDLSVLLGHILDCPKGYFTIIGRTDQQCIPGVTSVRVDRWKGKNFSWYNLESKSDVLKNYGIKWSENQNIISMVTDELQKINTDDLPSVAYIFGRKYVMDKPDKEDTNEANPYSYFAVSVTDGYNTYIGYGAEDRNDRVNLDRIQTRLGEKHYTHYYTKGLKKRYGSYNQLRKALEDSVSYYSRDDIVDKDTLDSNIESYYVINGR